MKQGQFSHKQLYRRQWSQFSVDSVQFNNSVDVAKFMNYEQIQFSYKAEDNSEIIQLN